MRYRKLAVKADTSNWVCAGRRTVNMNIVMHGSLETDLRRRCSAGLSVTGDLNGPQFYESNQISSLFKEQFALRAP